MMDELTSNEGGDGTHICRRNSPRWPKDDETSQRYQNNVDEMKANVPDYCKDFPSCKK